MTDIEKIRVAIDDPSLELLAWADLEEEQGNATRAWGLRKLAEGRRWPRPRPHKRTGWRLSSYDDKNDAIFSKVGGSDMIPRFGPRSRLTNKVWAYPIPPFNDYTGFKTTTDALVAAADYIGKCLEIRNALRAARDDAVPAAG